jgi:cellobiose transport system permease protein
MKKTSYIPYVFISPYFIIYIAFSLFPIVYTFYLSFMEWNGIEPQLFVRLRNYIALIADSRAHRAIMNTFLFMIMIIPIQIIGGLLIASVLSSDRIVGKGTFRLLNFLPFLTTPVAIGIIFQILFDYQFGPINFLLDYIGLIKEPINWLGRPWTARITISLVTIWRYYGYTAVLFMAGITNINPELYEASIVDGANATQRFFRITLPLLRPVTIFVVITTMIGCFQIFDEPFIMFYGASGVFLIGGPKFSCLTGVWLLYDVGFGSAQLRFGYGSAIAYVLFLIIGLLSILAYRFLKIGERR